MGSIETIQNKVAVFRRKQAADFPDLFPEESLSEPVAGFSDDDLSAFVEASGHALSTQLRSFLRTPGIFVDMPEVFLEDIGYFALSTPQTMIEQAENLRDAIAEYGWNVPASAVISFVNNEFIALDLNDGTVLSIGGDDGYVSRLECSVEEFLGRVSEVWIP
jgi:hypothetical protein